MSKKVGVFSRSAGCGKTTSCAYLSLALTMIGKKVKLIDISGDLSNLVVKENSNIITVSNFSYALERIESEDFESIQQDDLDYIFVDVPSELENLDSIFSYLDEVIILVEAEFYGLDDLRYSLDILKKYPNVAIKGFLLTHCNPNSEYPNTLANTLEEYFPNLVFESRINQNYYLSLPEYAITSLGGTAFHGGFINYLKLANEIVEHEY